MHPLDISSEQFRRLAEHATRLAADYLQTLDSRPIYPGSSGKETDALFHTEFPEKGLGEDVLSGLQDVIKHSRAQNGRFFGYVLGSGESVGATAELLASVLNQNVTSWRSAPAAVAIEKTVVAWLAQAIGCQPFVGSLTGGGSSANLMGLAMAREAKMPANERGVGTGGAVYASEEAHMSIPKSLALLGIGRENLRLISTNNVFQMIPEELHRIIVGDKEAGKTPIAVVATAGTVNTGAIDPIREVAEIARHHGAWLHVDGAYGALAALAVRDKFNGLELADSLSLDPHKWLYQSLDVGCLLYRDANAAQKAFSYSGEYARSLSTDPLESFSFFEESLELSRRFRALKLWLSLRYHGFERFREAVKKDLAHARRLSEQVESEEHLELLAPAELSAVCFRYRGKGQLSETELNRLNPMILKRVIERGRVYLSNAWLRQRFCLRACIVNHRTTDSDVDDVIAEVLSAAEEI